MGDLGRDRRCAMEGSRRPLRCQAKECRSETGEDDRGVYLRVAFALEPGCYATSLTREVCKGDE